MSTDIGISWSAQFLFWFLSVFYDKIWKKKRKEKVQVDKNKKICKICTWYYFLKGYCANQSATKTTKQVLQTALLFAQKAALSCSTIIQSFPFLEFRQTRRRHPRSSWLVGRYTNGSSNCFSSSPQKRLGGADSAIFLPAGASCDFYSNLKYQQRLLLKFFYLKKPGKRQNPICSTAATPQLFAPHEASWTPKRQFLTFWTAAKQMETN